MRDERCMRVHEHSDEHGCHGKGDDVDAHKVVTHNERSHQREQRQQSIEHGYASGLVEIVAPEERKIKCEEHHNDCHEQHLSYYCRCNLVRGSIPSLHLALKRVEHTACVFVHNVAPVDYLLTAHDHPTCRGDAAEKVAKLRLAALLVVDKIRFEIGVEVASLQDGALLRQRFVDKELLICRKHGEETACLYALGAVSVHQAYHRCGVFIYLVVLRRVHDASLIELVEAHGNHAYILTRQSRDAVLVVVEKLLHLHLLHVSIVIVVRLKGLKQRIFLRLYRFRTLIDREIKRGNERTVHPRLADIIAITLTLTAGQRPNDDGHSDKNKHRLAQKIAPETAFGIVEIHFLTL